MTIRSIGPLLCGGLLMLAILTPVAATAAPINGNCSPSKGKFSASALIDSSTQSTVPVTIPEATISFVQGGTSASCVIVRFSAGICAPGGGVYVRAFLDQTTPALPIDINYASNDACFQAHAFEFIFPSVAPGVHTVRMQYRSLSGTIVYVARHNTVVQFAP